MGKLLLVLLLSMGSILPSMAQSLTDPIEIKGNKQATFYQKGNTLTPRQIKYITQENPEANLRMKRAKSNSDVATIFASAGGMLIGWPIGTLLAGGKPNLTLVGIGAGLFTVSLPFTAAYQKHARHAVEIYNNGLNSNVKIQSVTNNLLKETVSEFK